jgi:hypothetical protein
MDEIKEMLYAIKTRNPLMKPGPKRDAIFMLYAIKTRNPLMKPGPKRDAIFNEVTGKWDLIISPPSWSKFAPSKISLTPDQYERYQTWLDKGELIQDALHELSPAEREVLLSGISPEEWTEAFGEDDE